MDALWAFITIIAIIAIVLVAGGIIAFLGHMIIGVFDKDRSEPTNKDLLDYNQYKQLENSTNEEGGLQKEFDFEAINEAKAEKEAELAKADEDVNPEEVASDEDIAKIETELKTATEEEKPAEDEDIDLDSLLDEISDEVVDEEQANAEVPTMSEELQSYSIDDLLNQAEEEAKAEEAEEVKTTEAETEEVSTESAEPENLENEAIEEVDTAEEAEQPAEQKAVTETVVTEVVDNSKDEEIAALKAELAKANQELKDAKTAPITVVTLEMTEEECLARIATLEDRLKSVRKDYRTNMKEYRPLMKIMKELERNQAKLRRREAIAAKQKVDLYGVDNYVDIDKEKAQKLAAELDFLDGLRLSVQHCEDVINANKDRYPILERTNKILENQIENLESDLQVAQFTLQKIRERNGEGNE